MENLVFIKAKDTSILCLKKMRILLGSNVAEFIEKIANFETGDVSNLDEAVLYLRNNVNSPKKAETVALYLSAMATIHLAIALSKISDFKRGRKKTDILCLLSMANFCADLTFELKDESSLCERTSEMATLTKILSRRVFCDFVKAFPSS